MSLVILLLAEKALLLNRHCVPHHAWLNASRSGTYYSRATIQSGAVFKDVLAVAKAKGRAGPCASRSWTGYAAPANLAS